MRPDRGGLGGPSRGLLLVLWTLAASRGCGDRLASAPTSAVESLLARARTAHFDLNAGLAPDDTVAAIASGLEARYGRVVADLETGEVARIRVEVWKDEASFFAEMERYFGRRYNATGYVTGPSVIRVLAVPEVVRNATHEMSHAISLRVNPCPSSTPIRTRAARSTKSAT